MDSGFVVDGKKYSARELLAMQRLEAYKRLQESGWELTDGRS